MIKLRMITLSVLSLLLLASCGNEPKQAKEEQKDKSPEVCWYSYAASQTHLIWTAYKFTEKTGVKGSFDSLGITTKAEALSVPELLTGAEFAIPITSINTANPERDKKIQKFFFGKLASGSHLKGKVSDVLGDNEAGSLNFSLMMNEVEMPVTMEYTLSGDTLMLSGTMDVNNWKAQSAIKALNKECEALHKGADGKTMLWPDVHLELHSVLKKTCQ